MVRIGLFVVLAATVCWVVLGFGAQASAQDTASEEPSGPQLRWIDHYVVKGGPIVWFILIPLSVATVALIIEHAVSIRRTTILPPEAKQRITAMLEEKRYVDAVRFTGEDPSVLGYVVNTALLEAGRGFAAMERALVESLDDRSARLMRKIEYLNVIGNVSPMIGLFGTVYGMVQAFLTIRGSEGQPEQIQLADDISVALLTTLWGLGVAIFALSAFAILRNRIDMLTAECTLACEKLLAVFKPSAESAAPKLPSTAADPLT